MMSKWFFVLFYGILQGCSANFSSSEEYDISNIFLPSFRNETLPQMQGVYYKNVTIDVEKIDIDKMKTKLTSLHDNIMQHKVMDMEEIKDTRRQSLMYQFAGPSVSRASMYMVRTKLADLMLQHIYMARHKLKALEEDPHFSKTDTGYRIGYLYKHMRRVQKKLRNILRLMKGATGACISRVGKTRTWKDAIDVQFKMLILHEKAIKIHNDFLYLWWVLIKVDGLFLEALKQRPYLPKSMWIEGGITDDDDVKIG